MKLKVSKNTLLIVMGIFIVLFLVILITLLKNQFGKNYPENPIPEGSLGTTQNEIEISDIQIEDSIKETPLYAVDRKVHISVVEDMIDELGLSLKKNVLVEDSYIEWSDTNNRFTYEALTDTLVFEIDVSTSISRGESGFTEIFTKYFSKEYDFVLNKEEKRDNGGISYYGSRVLSNVPIERGYGDEYSDILAFNKNGELEGGKLLLAEITEYDVDIPLISQENLKAYANSTNYPKESYLDLGVLSNTLNLSYLSDDWGDIEKSASGCRGYESSTILLFKNTEQGYILPTFKVDSTCSVEYRNSSYSVPATFYLNAVDTDYISE